MNIVEVQDNLKNFSQDQLINEINQPSGMVPQFLVLTELGRRNRIKQDMEGRQAQNQPTVAQEVVSAAGVPQGGIMEMARSMAPKSSIEQNDGVQMMKEGGKPKNRMEMLLAYLRSLGADEEEEIKEATGGKSIAEIINFGGDFRPVEKADGGVVKMQRAGSPTREVVYGGKRYITDGSGRVFNATRKGSKRRGSEVKNPEIVSAVLNIGPNVQPEVGGIANISTNLDTFSPVSSGIKPVNAPDPTFSMSTFMPPVASMEDEIDKFKQLPQQPLVKGPKNTLNLYDESDVGALSSMVDGIIGSDPTIDLSRPDGSMISPSPRPEAGGILEGAYIADPRLESPKIESFEGSRRSTSGLPDIEAMENIGKLRSQQLNNLDTTSNLPDFTTNKDLFRGFPFSPDFRESPQLRQAGALDAEQESLGADTLANLAAEQSLMDEGAKIAAAMDAEDKRLKPADKIDPDLFIDPTKNPDDPSSKISALESEIANMLEDNKERAEQDKWLALANAGLALMSSSNPTFGGAIGEAGQAGLTALRESQDQYNEDKLSLLALQQRAEAARLANQKSTTPKQVKINEIKGVYDVYTKELEKMLEPDPVDPNDSNAQFFDPEPKTYDDLTDAQKARYTDLLLKRQALEAMLTARIFPFELDATK